MARRTSALDLRDALSHVRWIGGGSAAGKSTVAELLARRHGLRHVSTDATMGEHAARMSAGTAPHLDAFRAMSMDRRWLTRPPQEMLDTFHWFRGEGFDEIVEDLLALPRSPGIVIDGLRLLPRLVGPLLQHREHAIWLLPTPEFRLRALEARGTAWEIADKTSDPPRAQANLLERDRLFPEQLGASVHEMDLPCLQIDGARGSRPSATGWPPASARADSATGRRRSRRPAGTIHGRVFVQVDRGVEVVVLTGLRSKHFVALVNRLIALPLATPPPPSEGPTRAFRFSTEQIAAIIQAYKVGATIASLAEQHDVKRQSIAAVLKREGVSIRPRKVFSPAQIDEAVALYDTGLSAATIADQFGFDAATIWRALKKRGVQMRSPNDWQY